MGEKADDAFTVPLCRYCHIEQHEYGNERRWWANKGINPIWLAQSITLAKDHAHAEEIVAQWREMALTSG